MTDKEQGSVTHDRLDKVEGKQSFQETFQTKLLAWAKALGVVNALVLLACVVSIGGAVLYTQRAWASDMKTISDAGVAPVAERLDKHIADEAEARKDQREFNREVLRRLDENSADNRALYKTVLTGERQYRLERPLPVPDGGP